MYAAYDMILRLALLAGVPYLLLRRGADRRYLDGWRERLGHLPQQVNPLHLAGIWIQAVSVGEVLLARRLMEGIRSRTVDARIYLSTTTRTGRTMADGLPVPRPEAVLYFPLDITGAVRRTLNRLQPSLFIAMETEIWPALLRALGRRGVPAVIVNGRISPAAFRRYRRVRFFLRRVLRDVDRALMQTDEDAERLRLLGMPPERLAVTGNLKFDSAGPRAGDHPGPEFGIAPDETVFIAGSTAPGEEPAVLQAFETASRAVPRPLLILAPRHPERFGEVAALLGERDIPFERRSRLPAGRVPGRRVLLLDTLGELARLYPRGRVIFVGGSLVPRGGHNVLEAAACGRPVIFGPHMENFREVADRLRDGGAAFPVADAAGLAETMALLARDEALWRRSGEAARAVVEANRGALERTLNLLDPYLRRYGQVSC